jgi:hypothetical protein
MAKDQNYLVFGVVALIVLALLWNQGLLVKTPQSIIDFPSCSEATIKGRLTCDDISDLFQQGYDDDDPNTKLVWKQANCVCNNMRSSVPNVAFPDNTVFSLGGIQDGFKCAGADNACWFPNEQNTPNSCGITTPFGGAQSWTDPDDGTTYYWLPDWCSSEVHVEPEPQPQNCDDIANLLDGTTGFWDDDNPATWLSWDANVCGCMNFNGPQTPDLNLVDGGRTTTGPACVLGENCYATGYNPQQSWCNPVTPTN